jgi:nitroimidazol reductase NimA-like FMN-containing flavoprotein (pyridoxamine 5'-phosphate oxidase superfamily)
MTVKADIRLGRLPERGSQDMQTAKGIIDDARICHVGFSLDGQPYVVPMAVGRDGDRVLLHGSVVSRLMKNLADGLPCCVTITHLDGLVLARSSFNSSMNYRSLMVFGTAALVADEAEKKRALDILVEHLAPGRLAELRPSTRKEINATTVLSLPLETFSIKSRNGPPGDAKGDLDTRIWAGVIPLSQAEGEPQPAPDMPEEIPLPAYLQAPS